MKGDLKNYDVKAFPEFVRDFHAWAENDPEAALNAPYHLFFFSAVDRNGVTRFFDIMKDGDISSLAETATSAPRLCQCVETVYTVSGKPGEFHHVHRNYGQFSTGTPRRAMHDFAELNGLTQLTEIAETGTLMEGAPTWKMIYEKLGCPVGEFEWQSHTMETRDSQAKAPTHGQVSKNFDETDAAGLKGGRSSL